MSRCGTCDISLRSDEEVRGHYSSELHLTNVRRRVDGKAPIKERDWVQEDNADNHRNPDGPPIFSCTLCRKTFRSVQTLQSHVRSTAHLIEKEKRIISREGEGTILTTTSIGTAALGLHRRNRAKLKAKTNSDKNSNAVPVPLEEREEDTSETRCLFCGHQSEDFKNNLRHLDLVHSFSIPMEEYCKDKKEFIAYLARKVNGLVCLVCNEKTKSFVSLQALRDHMRERNHEKVVLDEEYQEFFDCSLYRVAEPVKLFGVKGSELTVKTEGQLRRTIIKRESDVPRYRHRDTEDVIEQRRAITANENSALMAAREEQRKLMREENNEMKKTIIRSEAQYHQEQLRVGLRTNKLHPKGYDGEG